MNILKRALYIFLLFLFLIAVASMFFPSKFSFERKTIIKGSVHQVFNQVNELKNWSNWSPWALKDSSIYENESAYSYPSSGENATFTWDSENEDLGSGKLKILKSEVNSLIETEAELDFSTLRHNWYFSEVSEGIEVKWVCEVELGFNPIMKFFGLFLEEEIGQNCELGLSRLKTYTENLPNIQGVEVGEELILSSWFLSIRDSINPVDMNNIHGKLYERINTYLDSEKIEIAGSPLVIYHFWSDTLVDIEAGIPIGDSVLVSVDDIKLNKIEEGKVVTAVHYGDYSRIPETYFGINEWMRKNKVVVTGPPWEIYKTDPTKESNPEKWETAIFFPIK